MWGRKRADLNAHYSWGTGCGSLGVARVQENMWPWVLRDLGFIPKALCVNCEGRGELWWDLQDPI